MEKGEIIVDGKDIRDVKKEYLRKDFEVVRKEKEMMNR